MTDAPRAEQQSATLNGVTVTVSREDDGEGRLGVPYVIVDTEEKIGRIKVDLNDGPLWDGDPDTTEFADGVAAAEARHPAVILPDDHRSIMDIAIAAPDTRTRVALIELKMAIENHLRDLTCLTDHLDVLKQRLTAYGQTMADPSKTVDYGAAVGISEARVESARQSCINYARLPIDRVHSLIRRTYEEKR